MSEVETGQFRYEYTIFRKENALLLTKSDSGKIMFMFRKNPNPEEGRHFPKDTQTVFALDVSEALKLAKFLDIARNNKEASITFIHDPNAGTEERGHEIKTLQVGWGQKMFGMTLTVKSDDTKTSYTIPLSKYEIWELNLYLKLMLYEHFTGTKQGFRYDWI